MTCLGGGSHVTRNAVCDVFLWRYYVRGGFIASFSFPSSCHARYSPFIGEAAVFVTVFARDLVCVYFFLVLIVGFVKSQCLLNNDDDDLDCRH